MFNLRNKKNPTSPEATQGTEKKEGQNGVGEVSLDKKIEALLFYKGEELSLKFLLKTLQEKKGLVQEAMSVLKERLKNSALVLVENNNSYLLTTRPEYAELIKTMEEKEEMGELSKPALETLSIILYKGPILKAMIDEIRGVNSSYILRNLLIRGLVERGKEDGRNVYLPAMDLFRFLGVENKESLPAYQEVLERLEKIEENNIQNENMV